MTPSDRVSRNAMFALRRPSLPVALLALLAAGALMWALIAVSIADLGLTAAVPRIFYSRHVEHFLAFYVIGVLATAGFPNIKLKWTFASLAAVATVFGLVRLLLIAHTKSAAIDDWLCEIGGAVAALIPILVGMLRQAFSEREG